MENTKHIPVYITKGTVIQGRGIGKLVGMPTANLKVEQEHELPTAGVYIAKVLLKGKVYYGVTHIGTRPTVDNDRDISVETHILNFNEDLYGCEMEIQLFTKLRSPQRFDVNTHSVKINQRKIFYPERNLTLCISSMQTRMLHIPKSSFMKPSGMNRQMTGITQSRILFFK